jgi:hypothetical protein
MRGRTFVCAGRLLLGENDGFHCWPHKCCFDREREPIEPAATLGDCAAAVPAMTAGSQVGPDFEKESAAYGSPHDFFKTGR